MHPVLEYLLWLAIAFFAISQIIAVSYCWNIAEKSPVRMMAYHAKALIFWPSWLIAIADNQLGRLHWAWIFVGTVYVLLLPGNWWINALLYVMGSFVWTLYLLFVACICEREVLLPMKDQRFKNTGELGPLAQVPYC